MSDGGEAEAAARHWRLNCEQPVVRSVSVSKRDLENRFGDFEFEGQFMGEVYGQRLGWQGFLIIMPSSSFVAIPALPD